MHAEKVFHIKLSHAGLSQLQLNVIRSRYSDKKLQFQSSTAGPLSVSHSYVSFPVHAENPEDARILGARMWNKFALDAKRVGHGDWPFYNLVIWGDEGVFLQEEWFK